MSESEMQGARWHLVDGSGRRRWRGLTALERLSPYLTHLAVVTLTAAAVTVILCNAPHAPSQTPDSCLARCGNVCQAIHNSSATRTADVERLKQERDTLERENQHLRRQLKTTESAYRAQLAAVESDVRPSALADRDAPGAGANATWSVATASVAPAGLNLPQGSDAFGPLPPWPPRWNGGAAPTLNPDHGTFPPPPDPLKRHVVGKYDKGRAERCVLMTPLLRNWKANRDRVRGHITRFLCAGLPLIREHRYTHVIIVNHAGVVEVLRKWVDLPPNVIFQVNAGPELGGNAKNRQTDAETWERHINQTTTMRLDDDDIVNVDYIDECCNLNEPNTVMYPGNHYLYATHQRVLTKFKYSNPYQSYGLCVTPNKHHYNALSKSHVYWHTEGQKKDGLNNIVNGNGHAYYIRHGGNNAPHDEIPFFVGGVGEYKSKYGNRWISKEFISSYLISPVCKDFTMPQAFWDEIMSCKFGFMRDNDCVRV